MFVQQFYVESLGHYSYLIGSLQDGVAFAVDPEAGHRGLSGRGRRDGPAHHPYPRNAPA